MGLDNIQHLSASSAREYSEAQTKVLTVSQYNSILLNV